jgi:hypothetical protein
MEELKDFVKPAYTLDKVPSFKGWTYKNLSVVFRKEIDGRVSDPYQVIASTIESILSNEDLIEKTIKADFTNERIKETSDYYTLNLLRYFEALHGFNDYARALINVAAWETLQENNKFFKEQKTPAVIKRDANMLITYDNATAFTNVINRLNMPFKDFLKSVEDLKGHSFQETDFSKDTPLTTTRRLDPHKTGFVNVNLNPAYHIGLAYNAWQDKRHKRNLEERQQLQLILLSLSENLNEETDTAKIEALNKQIAYYGNEVNKLSIAIDEMEGRD